MSDTDAIFAPSPEEHENFALLLLTAASYTVDGEPEFDGDPVNTQRLQAAQVHATLAMAGLLRAGEAVSRWEYSVRCESGVQDVPWTDDEEAELDRVHMDAYPAKTCRGIHYVVRRRSAGAVEVASR